MINRRPLVERALSQRAIAQIRRNGFYFGVQRPALIRKELLLSIQVS